MTWLLNLALDLLFGKQEKIERYTGPQPIRCSPMQGETRAAVGRPEGGDYECPQSPDPGRMGRGTSPR